MYNNNNVKNMDEMFKIMNEGIRILIYYGE
jgi:hypothetical protein